MNNIIICKARNAILQTEINGPAQAVSTKLNILKI